MTNDSVLTQPAMFMSGSVSGGANTEVCEPGNLFQVLTISLVLVQILPATAAFATIDMNGVFLWALTLQPSESVASTILPMTLALAGSDEMTASCAVSGAELYYTVSGFLYGSPL